jgi:dCMP deaminase
MNIPTKEENYSKICYVIAERSKCLRHKFGAAVVKNNEIIAAGYNGAPRKMPHCNDIGCLRDERNIEPGTSSEICRGVHAEQNALIQAGRNAMDGTLYVNAYPCKICAKLIINARLKQVIISGEYIDKEGIELLKDAGIEVKFINLSLP